MVDDGGFGAFVYWIERGVLALLVRVEERLVFESFQYGLAYSTPFSDTTPSANLPLGGNYQ